MADETTGAPAALPRRELTVNQAVAANIAFYRQAASLTQRELGERLGWSNVSVSEAERSFDGRRREFDAQELCSLAWALGVPVLALFLPLPEDDREYRYTAGTAELGTAEMLEKIIVPNPDDDDSPAVEAYRHRFSLIAERYLDPDWAESVGRWLHDRAPSDTRIGHAARLRAWAQEQREAAEMFEKMAAGLEGEAP